MPSRSKVVAESSVSAASVTLPSNKMLLVLYTLPVTVMAPLPATESAARFVLAPTLPPSVTALVPLAIVSEYAPLMVLLKLIAPLPAVVTVAFAVSVTAPV